jgi:hypothetical protein
MVKTALFEVAVGMWLVLIGIVLPIAVIHCIAQGW